MMSVCASKLILSGYGLQGADIFLCPASFKCEIISVNELFIQSFGHN